VKPDQIAMVTAVAGAFSAAGNIFTSIFGNSQNKRTAAGMKAATEAFRESQATLSQHYQETQAQMRDLNRQLGQALRRAQGR
jgi:hypothetical protein